MTVPATIATTPAATSTTSAGTNASTTATTTMHLNKWVRNLLGTPLTEAQVSLLAHGADFAAAPRHPPYGEYITVVELACLNLEPHSAEELRAEIRGALKHSKNPKRNISKEEVQVLAELKKDQSSVILTADKGVAIVVMDREEYNKKAQELLEDGGTYKILKSDPTNRIKNKLINLLKEDQSRGGINENLYKKMYPTGAVPPIFYGLPRIHKRDIVSSRGSISYEVARELARILRPLVGSPPTTSKTQVIL